MFFSCYCRRVVFAVQIEGLIVEGPNMNQNNIIVQEFRVGYFDSVELCSDLVDLAQVFSFLLALSFDQQQLIGMLSMSTFPRIAKSATVLRTHMKKIELKAREGFAIQENSK